jgi:thiamine biosynthesis lipoprotein
MEPDLHTIVVGRDAMACRFEIVFNAGEVPDATERAVEALDLVDEIEARITVYRDTSELARLNAAAAAGWQPVAEDLFELLAHARGLFEQTGGGFDCASGALVRAWGFLQRQGRTPSAESLAAARAASGLQWVELDPAGSRVRFTRPGVELNLGAIGKGWAIDRAIEMLREGGVASALVHGGQSSVRAIGLQGPALPGRRGWRVGVRHPLRPGVRLATITLDDRALGTSGSGTQFFIDRGRKLGHILDPRTGVPAEGVLSATVIAPHAADADALSTALYVLGPEGLPRIAPEGGAVAAILVLPGRASGSVRLVTANLDDQTLAIEPTEGVEVAGPTNLG